MPEKTKCAFLLFALVTAAAVPIVSRQVGRTKPSFDVATVKPSPAAGSGIAVRTQPGGRFTATNATLKTLISIAYNVWDYQISGGPNWIASDRWNIEGKAAEGNIPPGTGPPDPSVPDPGLLRLQSLFEDRFQLKMHRATKQSPVYELVLAKTGAKMKLSADQEAIVFTPDVRQGGGPPRGMMRLNPRGNLEANGVPVSRLAQMLSEPSILGRPVLDKTDLRVFTISS